MSEQARNLGSIASPVEAFTAEFRLAQRLSVPELRHDETMFLLAEAFGDAEAATSLADRLDDASRPLFEAPAHSLRHRADTIVTAITDDLGLQAETSDHRALLLDHALRHRGAHPLLLAMLGHELARRAGFDSFVAWSPAGYLTVLFSPECFLPVLYGAPSRALRAHEVHSYCAHETAHAVLKAIATYAEPSLAASAARICSVLPVDCVD